MNTSTSVSKEIDISIDGYRWIKRWMISPSAGPSAYIRGLLFLYLRVYSMVKAGLKLRALIEGRQGRSFRFNTFGIHTWLSCPLFFSQKRYRSEGSRSAKVFSKLIGHLNRVGLLTSANNDNPAARKYNY